MKIKNKNFSRIRKLALLIPKPFLMLMLLFSLFSLFANIKTGDKNFFLEIKKAFATLGIQHEFAWGLDSSSSPTMGRRSNTGDDVAIAIKVGSSRGSDTDTVLRMQIVSTTEITTGERLGLYFTDCTGVSLKTCANRTISGTDPTSKWVPVEKQGGTATNLFRFREAENSSVIGGNQISAVVGVTEHNPNKGAWVEGSTTNAYSVASFTSATYPANDFSFEYYGTAPSVPKTYIFASTINETLPGWSGMHGSTGAILQIIPANWTGSSVARQGVSITGTTTATVDHLYADDFNSNSSTSISYSTTESGSYTMPAACNTITRAAYTFKDGSAGYKRSCNITGLTANNVYFFKVDHTDADGVSGSGSSVIGPTYTDQTKGVVHAHAGAVDANDTTLEDVGEIKENDSLASTIATSVVGGDGEYTIPRAGKMQLESFIVDTPANATLNNVFLKYKWGMNNVPERAQKLYRANAGTEPAVCSNVYGSEGGTNWTLVETLPNAISNWITEREVSLTGYTVAQLSTLDMCLANTNTGGSAASDVVAFDFLTLIPLYTPTSSGLGSPTAVTNAATLVASTQAQLNGTVHTQGLSGQAYFEYGTTTSYGSYWPNSTGDYVYNAEQGHSISEQPYFKTITGLTAQTAYHYRVCLKAPPSGSATCGSDATFTTASAGSLSVDIVDAGGVAVSSPSISFAAKFFDWVAQQSTGTLGAASQKIRITNTTSTPTWTLTVASTANTNFWTSGSDTYDFNNTASTGRLQINPSIATITPQSGCVSTGITKGTATYFTQGTQDSITLLSASGSAQVGCYWDITGIGLTQDIPAAQVSGSYSIPLVLTAA